MSKPFTNEEARVLLKKLNAMGKKVPTKVTLEDKHRSWDEYLGILLHNIS